MRVKTAFRIKTAFTLRMSGFALIAATASLLAGCEDSLTGGGSAMRAYHPIPPETLALMRNKGTDQNSAVLIRTYKKEAELEIWKMRADGHYTHLKTFPMCRWSGQLGPKVREGDRQVPEGFYSITPGQMNPNSAYYLSFNVGYPNAYDRAMGHTGGSIMVHGVCSSAGCFSMTDEQIAEIYAIAREGFNGGQRAIQMQSYPFHMTPENMAKYRADPNIAFWKQLKEGSDNFEVSKAEVNVGVCGKHYVFNQTVVGGGHLEASEPCPALKHDDALQAQVEAKETGDEGRVVELISQGVQPIHTVYADGGQNPAFEHRTGGIEVSRPEALAQGPIDIPIEEGKGSKKKPVPPAVQIAAAKAETEKRTQQQQGADAKPDAASAFAATTPPAGEKQEGSMIGRMFGWKSQPQPEAPAAPVETAAVPQQPAKATIPPHKTDAAEKPQALIGKKKPDAVAPANAQKPAATTGQKPVTGSSAALAQGFSAVANADQR
jgi:murein L,D-transpeptidase YafK